MTHGLIIRPDRVELIGIVRFSCFDLVPSISYYQLREVTAFVVVNDKLSKRSRLAALPFLRRSVLTNLST